MIDLSVPPQGSFSGALHQELLTVEACPTCGHKSFTSKLPKIIYDTALSQLRCGYTIPTEDRVTIAANVQRYKSDAQVITRELAALRSRIKRLEAQRTDIERAITYQSGLLSPIRNLPEEILLEILSYCSQGRIDVCSPRSEIWQLDRVCKRWRDIMRSNQSLWSTVDVYLGSLMPYRVGVPLSTVENLVERCIELSGDSSLSIRFVEIGSSDHFKKVFELFSKCSHRWKDISFSLSMLSEAPTLEHGLTRLRTLGLSGAYKGSEPFHSFQHAQQLQTLTMFSIPRPFHTIVIPWYQIRHFKALYCDFRTGEFMDMLQHMPSLVTLSSKWSKGLLKTRAGKQPRPISFRHLQHIELEAAPADMCTALEPLSAPLLRELYLVTQQAPGPGRGFPQFAHIADAVVAMLRRSRSCRLEKLSLSCVDAPCVARILEETPHLTQLTLIHVTDVESILQHLAASENLAPMIETFSLTCKGNQAMFSVGPLAGIIRTRSARYHGGQLKSVHLTVRESGGVERFAELLEPLSRDNGVAITIHSLAS